jgi:UDP-2-acetamido-2,6-beta-L-arabino-hexul-4-ose reductase
MKVAVTGSSGFLGWHIRCGLHASNIEHVGVGREHFSDAGALVSAIADCSAVVHAAGANRGDDAEVERTNIRLAQALNDAASGAARPPLIVYLNSTQFASDTPYGRSKKAAAEILGGSGVPFLDLVLPGVFGEGGRPNYNSVVSTFCHQLTNGVELTIHSDAPVELVHAQDVADAVVGALGECRTGHERVQGERLTVVELAHRLQGLHARYEDGVVPPAPDRFGRALFNTLRSYRFPGLYPTQLDPRIDARGRLVELVKADTGGQTFISTTRPGVTRGQHYHRRKLERFAVVEGEATISLRRLFDSHVVSFEVSGERPVAVDMPTLHTHNITNVDEGELVTVFWTDEIFDPEATDTYPEAV